MRLESGAPRGTKTYWTVVLAVCLGLSGWFLWDYLYGYAEENLEAARRHFGLTQEDPLDLSRRFTQADLDAVATPQQARTALGDPLRTESLPDGSSVESYASLYGLAVITLRGGQIAERSWQDWEHSKRAIDSQLMWAFIPALFALFALAKLVRTLRLRVVLDDDGLDYGGLRIPFADMTGLSNYSPKGWLDLNYTVGGQPRKLRLDNQRVEKYDELIRGICERTGWPAPGGTGAGGAGGAGPAGHGAQGGPPSGAAGDRPN